MNRNHLAIASIAVMLLMAAIGVAVATALPGDVQLPIHWGVNGEPDSFSDKWTALLMPVVIAGGVSLLFHFLPALEPRHRGFERSQSLYLWGWASLLLMSMMVQLAVVTVALNWSVHGTSFILAGLGIMFLIIGNQLGKSRSMYMIGFRTPWTLASEDVWISTHRLAGKLMVAGGLAIVVAAFLPVPGGLVATLLVAIVAIAVGWPLGYSYVLWRREQSDGRSKE